MLHYCPLTRVLPDAIRVWCQNMISIGSGNGLLLYRYVTKWGLVVQTWAMCPQLMMLCGPLFQYTMFAQYPCWHSAYRHRENFCAFTGPTRDFGLILLILNMMIHKNFTGPTHFLSANVRGLVSFAVSEHTQLMPHVFYCRSCSASHLHLDDLIFKSPSLDATTLTPKVRWKFFYLSLISSHSDKCFSLIGWICQKCNVPFKKICQLWYFNKHWTVTFYLRY